MSAEETAIIQNADAAAEAARNAAPGTDLKPEISPERSADLDALFAQTTPVEGDERITDPANPAADAPAQEQKPADEKPPEQKSTEQKPADEKPASDASKSLVDDLLGKETAQTEPKKEDPYDAVKLRSDASPKTQETFTNLKNIARQREADLQTQVTTITKERDGLAAKVQELESKQTELPEDVRKELDELRQFRATFDTENDPSFKQKFDTRIDGNYGAIYSTLTSHGLPAAELEKLKAMDRAERDQVIEGFLDKLPPNSRRSIEAKLVDNVNVEDARRAELQQVKGRAAEVLQQKTEAAKQAAVQREQQIVEILKPQIAKLDFLAEKEIPQNATADQRKQIEDHNALALDIRQRMSVALTDDSPKTRVESALAVALAKHFHSVNARLTAQVAELTGKLDKITKASSTSRLSERSIASPSAPSAPKKEVPADGGDAVDQLLAEITGGQK